MSSEQDIIRRVKRGDERGYREMVAVFGRRVKLLLVQMTQDERDAEELAQDTFMKVFDNIHRFDARQGRLNTWIARIAYNTALNHLKKKGVAFLPIETIEQPPPDDDADGKGERLDRLRDAIDRLRPDEQLLLHLHYYEEQSLQEIGQILHAEPAPLANRLQRIRQKLRNLINHRKE